MKRSIIFAVLALALDARTGDLVMRAPESELERVNPFEFDERARLAGAKLFEHNCAACHGRNAEGTGTAPGLNTAAVHDARPGTLFWVLRNGSLRTGMPSFAHLPEPERWQLVTFLKSIRP